MICAHFFQKFSKADVGEIIATLQDTETINLAFLVIQFLSTAHTADLVEFDQHIMNGMKTKKEFCLQGVNMLVDFAKTKKVICQRRLFLAYDFYLGLIIS